MCNDSENIEKLKNLEIISQKASNVLKESNGLRNRFVHEYNGLEEQTAFESITDLLPKFSGFIGKVRTWLKNQK